MVQMHQRFAANRRFRYSAHTVAGGTRYTVYGQRGEEALAFSFLRARGIISDDDWARRNEPGHKIELEFVPDGR